MNDRTRLLTWVYFAACLANLATTNFYPQARILTKPLLMPLLMACYASAIWPADKRNITFLVALFLSWVGDVLLLGKGSLWFTAGLAAFLMAHLVYIRYFLSIRSNRVSFLKRRPVMLLAVLVFVFELLHILWPGLGSLRIAVCLYAAVIGIMLCCALWQYGKVSDAAAFRFMAGGLLFVASDSLLAVARFRSSFPGDATAVMCTYCLAQYLLSMGSVMESRESKQTA